MSEHQARGGHTPSEGDLTRHWGLLRAAHSSLCCWLILSPPADPGRQPLLGNMEIMPWGVPGSAESLWRDELGSGDTWSSTHSMATMASTREMASKPLVRASHLPSRALSAQAVALLPSSCPPEAISLCQNPAGWGKVAQDTSWCVGAGGEGRGLLPGTHARHTCQGAAEALLATGTFPAHPQSHKTQPRPFLTKEGRGQSTFLQNSLLLCPFLTSLAHREGCCF